ncbi:M56 family metallopeptidase [Olivibacter sp. CPCC 100613]|uniref:M56 family metallopeptidase n=1 Tax=Olivibacter sp. CPCC 100613 TaxID=3079931 RepID=UPI002FFAA23C
MKRSEIQMMTWDDLVTTVPQKDSFWMAVTILFLSIVLILISRFFIQLISLLKIHRKSEIAIFESFWYRQIWLNISPFSFWKSIYLNQSLHTEDALREILKHETEHVRQLHTIDVLFVEILTICCWFNPAIWLTRSAIKENLEFLTDHKVLESGVDKKKYQYSLIDLTNRTVSPELSNYFNFNALKKRIMMMNKKKSSPLHLGKYLFIVPAVTISAMVFTVSKAYQEDGNLIHYNLPDSVAHTDNITLKGDAVGITIKEPNRSNKPVSQTANEKGQARPLYVLDGSVMKENEDLSMIDPNSIASVEVLKDQTATSLYGNKGENGVVLITTKVKKSNADLDLQAKGSEVEPAPNKIQPSTIKIKKITSADDSQVSTYPENVTYTIDGQLADKESVALLESEHIESINVVKDKANGTGTIHIKTKKK